MSIIRQIFKIGPKVARLFKKIPRTSCGMQTNPGLFYFSAAFSSAGRLGNIPSITRLEAAAAVSKSSCKYLWVVSIFVCPKRFFTVFRSAPLWIIIMAAECRRSCMRTLSYPICLRKAYQRRVIALGDGSLPSSSHTYCTIRSRGKACRTACSTSLT